MCVQNLKTSFSRSKNIEEDQNVEAILGGLVTQWSLAMLPFDKAIAYEFLLVFHRNFQ